MLRLLIDEDVHGDIVAGLLRRDSTLDLIRVQDVDLGNTPDPIILEWAANHGRVLVSFDKSTLPDFAWERVLREMPMPGVAILRPHTTVGQAINSLQLLALVGSSDDVRNQVIYLPM